ncbi:MAG: 30S ribosomal protein S8 [Ardenticatenales bacterium]|jgi:small subunit ribosomal protein S8|nr:30S ribosomal protein S8 [Ardenticatenales bacterium]MCC7018260.1 30S ribosomal protein S8 [Ardenticatenales bacterium]
MSMSDPIADLLTRVRNANERRHKYVMMPSSKIKVEIARILQDEGYINGFEVADVEGRPTLRMELRYSQGRAPVITQLERVSKPGRRVYAKRRDVPRVLQGMGIAILTTPRGVMTGKQARHENVGGEVLCYVW